MTPGYCRATPSASRASRRGTRSGSSKACPSGSAARLDPVALIERVEELGAPYGIGRGIHLGDTIIGTKGRVAFEAPAAEISHAHRELEKLVLAAPAAHQGSRRGALWRSRARRPVPRPRVPGHRGAACFVAGARHGRGESAAPPGSRVRRGRHVAVLADGSLEGRLWRGRRRMDADRCAGFSKDARRCPGMFHTRAGEGPRGAGSGEMKTPSSSTRSLRSPRPAISATSCASATDIPCGEGVVLVVEVLNNKSTYNTLELTSGRMAKVAQGRRHRRRTRPSQGAVRLFRPLAGVGAGRRRDPAAEHRRRARHLRLGQPRQGQALRLPRAGRRAAFPVSRRAHRRAGARRLSSRSTSMRRSTRRAYRSSRSPAPAWKPARPLLPARSSAACAIAGSWSMPSRRPASRLRRDILAMEDAGARRGR